MKPVDSRAGVEGDAPHGLRHLVRKVGSTWEVAGESAGLADGDLERLLALSPDPVPFFHESEIDDLIINYPPVIPGIQAPVAAATRFPVPGTGPADVVLVDVRGQITIVECKLEANSEARGQVIGQLLTYAAGLRRDDYYDEFERRFRRAKSDLTQPLKTHREWDEGEFRTRVRKNLSNGSFRLFVACDGVPPELDRAISYLDSTSQLPVIGLLRIGLHYCAEEATEILVLEDGSERRSRPRRARSREALVGAIRMRDPHAAEVADELLDWASSVGMELKPTQKLVSVVVPGGDVVFKIEGYESMIRVSLRPLRLLKAPEDRRRVEEVLAGLTRLDFALNDKRAKAPLRTLADDENGRSTFKALMKQAFAALTK